MNIELDDAAILGAAPIIRKVVDALVDLYPDASKYKLWLSGLFAVIVVGVKLVPDPFQSYIKLILALMFATAFYNDWYKSRKSDINVGNIEKVSVTSTEKEVQ